jgi:hypothetical protein
MRFSDENLRGRTVVAADGQMIGEITALFLDSDVWRVEALQVLPGWGGSPPHNDLSRELQ